MREKCLCFTGHRLIPEKDLPALSRALNAALADAYREGIRVFVSGGAMGFDLLAARAVLQMRASFPGARLVVAQPCPSQADRWASGDRQRYRDILSRADQVIRVSPAYYEGCMQKRNRFMVERACRCLCYLRACRGGTWYTVSYAYDQGLSIRNLALEIGGSAGS
ncbi:MAG: DUF1273 family protein [Clostridia bacterium]|nr:DUF1273 family protein [Clostridia bacterium]